MICGVYIYNLNILICFDMILKVRNSLLWRGGGELVTEGIRIKEDVLILKKLSTTF